MQSFMLKILAQTNPAFVGSERPGGYQKRGRFIYQVFVVVSVVHGERAGHSFLECFEVELSGQNMRLEGKLHTQTDDS
eukprot:4487254-Amphidinium_carterae.1